MKPKFKKGDKVVVTGDEGPYFNDRVGIVDGSEHLVNRCLHAVVWVKSSNFDDWNYINEAHLTLFDDLTDLEKALLDI